MGVDQLFVDPVAAALRQLVHVQFACGQHHLANRTAELISIDVDSRKVVVSPDFLNLTERILQRPPVPKPYVLERRLIAGRFHRLDSGVGGKRVGLDAVEREGPPRHFYVVLNEGTFSHQLIRRDDEIADVPAHPGDDEVADDGRNGDRQQPARARSIDRGDRGYDRAHEQRHADHQCAAQGDVSVRVGDTREDRTILEQMIEAPEVRAHREHQQERGEARRQAAPESRLRRRRSPFRQDTCAAGDRDEPRRDQAGDHRQCQQPSGDELQGRQRKEVKIERSPEDGIEQCGVARRVPVKGQGHPPLHHARARDDRYGYG